MKLRALLIFLVFAVEHAHAGSAVEDFLNTLFSRSHQYVALGKILAAPPPGDTSVLYGQILRALQSPSLLEAARQRVAKQHPEATPGAVEIKVMRSNGSSIIRVAVVGDQMKYTRMILDALMDVWLDQEQAEMMASSRDCLAKLLHELADAENACMTAEEKRAARKPGTDAGEFEKAKARFEAARERLEKYDFNAELVSWNAVLERPMAAIPTR